MRKRKLTTHNGWPLHNMSTLGGGRDNERVLFSIHNVPCTHHRLPCAMASSDNYGSKGTKRVGWDGDGGIYRLIASL